MPTPPLPDEVLEETVAVYESSNRNQSNAAVALGIARQTLQLRLKHAAQRGLLLDHPPAMPGFSISRVTTGPDGEQHVTQKPEHGDVFQMPPTHRLGKLTVNRDADGRVIQDWIRAEVDAVARDAAMRAVVDALKEEIQRADPVPAPAAGNADLLNQYTVTDLHFGMLSWGEETGADYDLKIAERLLLDWFAAAIAMSPHANTAVLAQLGDLLHHDSHMSVTPTNAHVLDADSRLQKIIRVVIRCMRQIVAMLLAKHDRVHIVMADANHDPAGGAWLREMFAAFFEDEPRVTVDSSAGTYYVFEHGETSLFYHHGHKRKIATVDSVFAGQFRDVYGRTKFSYAHIGHLHSDELKSTNLMKVERHETLAARDAYAANGGWLADRSAKVITYHRSFGEVSRITISPKMLVMSKDNEASPPHPPPVQ
jgi:hypothetical protein